MVVRIKRNLEIEERDGETRTDRETKVDRKKLREGERENPRESGREKERKRKEEGKMEGEPLTLAIYHGELRALVGFSETGPPLERAPQSMKRRPYQRG